MTNQMMKMRTIKKRDKEVKVNKGSNQNQSPN